jgi:hypothetical protein
MNGEFFALLLQIALKVHNEPAWRRILTDGPKGVGKRSENSL